MKIKFPKLAGIILVVMSLVASGCQSNNTASDKELKEFQTRAGDDFN